MKTKTYNTAVYLPRGHWKTGDDRELHVPFTQTIQRFWRIEPEDSYIDAWTNVYVVRVKFSRHTSKRLIREALSYHHSTQGGCGHSYDCCGCVTYRAYESNIVHIKRNEWEIVQYAYINC